MDDHHDEDVHAFVPIRAEGSNIDLSASGLSGDAADSARITWTMPSFTSNHDEQNDASASADADHDNKSIGDRLKESILNIGSAFRDVGRQIKEQQGAIGDLFSLSSQVSNDLKDTSLYPELERDAYLRRDNFLSQEETAFQKVRRQHIIQSGVLHRFLDLPSDEIIQPEDVPVVALGGSGGGYRACLGFLAYIEQMQAEELWDILTYVGGVSGSCWTIASLYVFTHLSAADLLHHFAESSSNHPLSAASINAVAESVHGVYFQLAPIVQKMKLGFVKPTPLDLYGTLTTTHIFLSPAVRSMSKAQKKAEHEEDVAEGAAPPDNAAREYDGALRKEWFKWSRAANTSGVNEGRAPLPILTAVRHERPWKDWKSPTDPFEDEEDEVKSDEDKTAWWQWWEFTPYEFGSDELEAWIPVWAFGRPFNKGVSIARLPEISLSLVLGLCTSAPAGPLSAYLGTIYRNLPHNTFGDRIREWSDNWSKNHKMSAERLNNHHPVHAQNEPNPILGSQKEAGRGHGFENAPRIHLVDSGVANNEPHTVFFRPGREPDVIILGDYSSDVQKGNDALVRVGDGLKDRGLKVVPRNPLDPLPPVPTEGTGDKAKPRQLSADEVQQRFGPRYAQLLDATLMSEDEIGPTTIDTETGVDIMNERNVPLAKKPCTIVYMPLLPNKVQPEYDPSTAPFSSSYNLVWTKDQVETIRKTSKANVADSLPILKAAIREAYETRKALRLSLST